MAHSRAGFAKTSYKERLYKFPEFQNALRAAFNKGEIMFKFILAIFLTVLPVICFAQPESASSQTDRDVQSLSSAFMAYTELRISSVQQSLGILASTTEVHSGVWEHMKGLLSSYQSSDDGLVVWFVRPDGSYYTTDKGLMSVGLSDRDYFPALMKGQKITGALVVSKSTGRRSAVIAVPVRQHGVVIGAIGASVFLDVLAERIDSVLDLGADTSFFALAPNGLTTLHKKTERHFLDPRTLNSETLKEAVNEMLSKDTGEVSYEFDHAAKTAVFRTSPVTQWKFVITHSVPQR
jgi:hypothetical protein